MKTGLLYSFQNSSWFSVTKIVGNLLKAYELALGKGNIDPINYSVDLTDAENKASIQEGLKDSVQRLVILDHRPHPRKALELIGQERLLKLEEVVIHVFGDFTLSLADWRFCEKYLKGTKLRFVCASDKQVSLIQKFIKQKEIVTKCPFPVDQKEFSFDLVKRKLFREKNGLQDDDFIYLYVGRMSLQKNIAESIRYFMDLKQSGDLKARHKFWLVGEFDVIGNPYVEDRHILGEYFRKIQRLLEGYSLELRKDVKFLGAVPNEVLNEYYNGCDRFLSLSSYQDEDYGMAVAEACVSGLPCALSDWAGYSSFRGAPVENFINYCKVTLGAHRATVDEELAKSAIIKSCSPFSLEKRNKAASFYVDKLTVEACAQTLQKEFEQQRPPEFRGFTEMLVRLGAIATFKPSIFMNEMSKTLNEFYYKVYDVYAE